MASCISAKAVGERWRCRRKHRFVNFYHLKIPPCLTVRVLTCKSTYLALSSPTAMSSGSSLLNPQSSNVSSATTTSSDAPALPERPSSLTAAVNRNASAYSPYGANRLGGVASPYGGIGSVYSSPYSSPYSRMGGMGYGGYGSGMYGGMGGYGSMYGGAMGGMYGGMGGVPGDPNDPNSLTNGFTQSTQATFQIIESIVGAFGGFAQMLESTYMATHSSFFGKSLMSDRNQQANSHSYGLGCRTIWKPSEYPRFDTGNLYYPKVATDSFRQDHWQTTTSRCYIPHTQCLCEVRGSEKSSQMAHLHLLLNSARSHSCFS